MTERSIGLIIGDLADSAWDGIANSPSLISILKKLGLGLPGSTGQKTAAGSTSMVLASDITPRLTRPAGGFNHTIGHFRQRRVTQFYYGYTVANASVPVGVGNLAPGTPIDLSEFEYFIIKVSATGMSSAPTSLNLVAQVYEPVSAKWNTMTCLPSDNLVAGTNNFPRAITFTGTGDQEMDNFIITRFSGLLRFGLYSSAAGVGGTLNVVIEAKG